MPIAESELQAARNELERVLGSPGFTRNERLAGFLRFVVERHLEGKDEEIKESVLAVEVFGRNPDHDPKQSSIVRTEASRLRARLNEYYLDEGKDDTVVIELPKGRYVPVLHQSVCRGRGRRSIASQDTSISKYVVDTRNLVVCGGSLRSPGGRYFSLVAPAAPECADFDSSPAPG